MGNLSARNIVFQCNEQQEWSHENQSLRPLSIPMSKPFFYRLNVADFAVAVMEIPEGGHREWIHQLVRDLASGNGTMPFSQKMIEEVANYRKIQAEHGSKGGKPKHKRPYSDPIGTLSDPIVTPNQALPNSSSSTEAVTKEEKKRFVPPSLEDVTAYCRERGNRVDPSRWLAYYESNGWRVGKNKMVNWKSAVITWENSDGRSGNPSGTGSTPQKKGGIIQPNGPDADWLGGT